MRTVVTVKTMRWPGPVATVAAAVLVLLSGVAALSAGADRRAGRDRDSGAIDVAAAGPMAGPIAAAPRATVDGGPGLLGRASIGRWDTFTTRDGLPSDQVFAVRVDGDRVWAGTADGLGLYENGRWRRFGTADGLPHRVILALDVSPRTGDLWIATMGGLARLSAGRLDAFRQIDSGLPNDFVNGVRCDPDEDSVWVATAMGAGRLDLKSGAWEIYTHENTPMHEPWTYSIAIGDGSVYVGAWGAGVLEYTKATGRWREYRDPDGQFEIDLFRDDGPINDVTSGVDYAAGVMWQSAYFGLARYDGREWRSFSVDDSGLASDFINFVRARGDAAWLATDQGLSVTDGADWVTYRRTEDGRGEILAYEGKRPMARRLTAGAPAHNYVLGVDIGVDAVWIATERGVSRGRLDGPSPAPRRPAAAGEPAAGRMERETQAETGRFRYAGTPGPLLAYPTARPYRELFKERSQFRGTGRELADPPAADVPIGFIGPLEGGDSPELPPGLRAVTQGDEKAAFGLRMLRAAILAAEQANAGGGYQGRPFRVVPRTDLVLWGQSSNELVGFALQDRVWAVLSGIDSNHTHVLSRATLKLEVPIVSAGVTDPTLVEHAIPWLVRAINDDRQGATVLLNEILTRRGLSRLAVLRVNDRDGRTGIMEFTEGARRLGHPIVLERRFAPGEADLRPQLTEIRETGPQALVLWGSSGDTGRAVRQARDIGMTMPIFGFDRMNHRDFLAAAGEAAEGVTIVAAMNLDSDDPAWRRFQDAYRLRWNDEPDTFAAHAYDGMSLIIGAIRRGGLSRARIRDELFALTTWRGVTGPIVFDTNMSDVGPLWLAVVRGGRFHYEPAPGWTDPRPASGQGDRRAAAPERR